MRDMDFSLLPALLRLQELVCTQFVILFYTVVRIELQALPFI